MLIWNQPLYQLELLPYTIPIGWCRGGDSNPHVLADTGT